MIFSSFQIKLNSKLIRFVADTKIHSSVVSLSNCCVLLWHICLVCYHYALSQFSCSHFFYSDYPPKNQINKLPVMRSKRINHGANSSTDKIPMEIETIYFFKTNFVVRRFHFNEKSISYFQLNLFSFAVSNCLWKRYAEGKHDHSTITTKQHTFCYELQKKN